MITNKLPAFTTLIILSLTGLLFPNLAIAQNPWQQTNGPFGGTVWELAMNRQEQLFAGTYQGGIFISSDKGQSWQSANKGLHNLDVRALAINAQDEIFAGTFGDGLFRSTDGGASWQQINGGLATSNIFVFSLAIDARTQAIYAGTATGVIRSADNGETWGLATTGLPNNAGVEALAVDPQTGEIFAALPFAGLFRSQDGGGKWLQIDNGFTATAVLLLPNSLIFAGTADGVYFSRDNGANWVAAGNGLTVPIIQAFGAGIEGEIYACTDGGGIFRSVDLGANWTPVNQGLTSNSIRSFLADVNGVFFVGSSGVNPAANGSLGVYRSSDGGNSWALANTGFINTKITALTTTNQGGLFAGTFANGIFRSTDQGKSWQQANKGLVGGPISDMIVSTARSGEVVYAAVDGFGQGVFRSIDNGGSWQQLNKGLENAPGVQALAINSTGHLWAVSDGPYFSLDAGVSWNSANVGAQETLFRALAINASDHIFIGAPFTGVLRSTDGGATWQQINKGLANLDVTALVTGRSGTLFAALDGGGVFRSINNGDDWTPADTGLPGENIFILAIAPNGALLAMPQGQGVFLSTDDGQSWQSFNDGLANPDVLSAAFTTGEGVFAGTNGSGVFQNTLPKVAQDVFWASPVSGRWNDPGNWNTNAIPGTDDRVFIDRPGTYTVTVDSDATVASLQVGQPNATGGETQTLVLNGSTLTVNGNSIIQNSGNLEGNGTIAADVANAGRLSPGSPVGVLAIKGNYTQTQSGVLNIDIDGVVPGAVFDRLDIGGQASFDGVLNIQLVGQFLPSSGSSFTILSFASRVGDFASMTGLDISDALRLSASYTANDLTLVVAAPGLSLSQNAIDFGQVTIGEIASRSVSLANNGSIDLAISATEITGANAQDFAINGGGAVTLQPGASVPLTIRFSPLAEGIRTAELTITSNAPSSPDVVALKGAGAALFALFDQVTTGSIFEEGRSSTSSSWVDFDNDGDDDLFVTTGDATENNVLFENIGDTTFTKTNAGDLTGDLATSRAATWGDFDNDGNTDVFIANDAGENNFLYANNGNGAFSRVTTGEIANDGGFSTSASWGDFDSDGNLDLFVANRQGPNFLYKNNGDGTFTKAATGAVVTDEAASMGCNWVDYDNDGEVDLFVVNGNGQNNALYRNNADGTFIKITNGPIVSDGGFSRGSSWGDFDNDGDPDVFVANENSEANFLYANNGDGTFTRITGSAIVSDVTSSAGSSWGDFDNDGDLDLFVANLDLEGVENFVYLNDGAGNFTRESLFDALGNDAASNGASVSDFDRDGDLDLFIANGGGLPDLFYTNNGNNNSWINIKLSGVKSNRSALGAKIRVLADSDGKPVSQMREISGQTGGGYGGQNSLSAAFGLGSAQEVASIQVEWPGGATQILQSVAVNRFLNIVEETAPVGDITVQVTEQPAAGDSLNFAVLPPTNFTAVSGQLFFRAAGESGYRSIPLTIDANGFVVTIPPPDVTIRGVQYYIVLTDGQNTITLPPTDPQISPRFIPAQIARITAPLELAAGKYKMVSVPLVLDESAIDSVLFDDYGEHDTFPRIWRLFRWQNLHYAEYRGIDAVFTPGTAFWLITRDGAPFDVENARSVDATAPYRITLQPGWNQISNPFAFPVAWENIAADGIVQPPVYYDGNEFILNVPVLQPWEGYFVFNLGLRPVTLTVPPIESPVGEIGKVAFGENQRYGRKASGLRSPAEHGNEKAGISPLEEPVLSLSKDGQGGVKDFVASTNSKHFFTTTQANDYTLQIAAAIPGAEFRDTQNFLGFKTIAQDGWDRTDYYEAPAITEKITLSIIDHGDRFAANFRAPTENGASWDIEISSNIPKAEIFVELREFGSLGKTFTLYVLDKDRGAPIPVQNNAFTIVLNKSASPRHLRIILGTDTFAENASEGIPLAPLSFILEQNYPNPFNPETAIRYQLSAVSEVELAIYDQLGRVVKTVVREQQPAGKHEVIWDGRDARGQEVASGVYLYRLRAGDFFQTRKMLLIR